MQIVANQCAAVATELLYHLLGHLLWVHQVKTLTVDIAMLKTTSKRWLQFADLTLIEFDQIVTE